MNDFPTLMAELPMVAILRGIKPEEVLAHGEALINAGFSILEVPLNSPEPFKSIELLQKKFGDKALIGAGTVMRKDQIDQLVEIGAGIMVCPHTDVALIRAAKAAGLYAFPGFFTASEAFAAIEAGADAIKLFPAEAMTSPNVISALCAVVPKSVRICPVGGVTPSNMGSYIDAGAQGFGLGSALYKAGQSVEVTSKNAHAFVAGWKAISELTA